MGNSTTAWHFDKYPETEYDKLGALKRRQQERVGQFSESIIEEVRRVLGPKAVIPLPSARLPQRQEPARTQAPRARVPSPGEINIHRIARIFESSGFSDLQEFSPYIERSGVNVRLRGQTALTVAAYSGSLEGTKLLISSPDININEQNDYGSTALMLAVQEGHISIVKILLADERIDMLAHDQWTKALKKARHPLIHDLIKRKLQSQKSALSIFKKLISLISR